MAEDQDNSQRTEDPTQKRLDDALKRGDVVKSQEVTTWFIIAGGTLVLVAFSGNMGAALTTTLRGIIANAHDLRVDELANRVADHELGLGPFDHRGSFTSPCRVDSSNTPWVTRHPTGA